ncbi:MAG: sulfotransferase domain-containing protein [Candidatus Babeliaceae bacterium]
MLRKIIIFLAVYHSYSMCTFILTSVPKTGTHLLARCLQLLVGKEPFYAHNLPDLPIFNELDNNNFFVCTHLPYEIEYFQFLKKNKIKIFLMIRDPRDQVVSFANWVYKYFAQVMTFSELINYLIFDGTQVYGTFSPFKTPVKGIADYYSRFLLWQDKVGICTVRFENLVGPKGGGSDLLQKQEIKKIARYLGIKIDKATMEYIQENLFGGTFTFREGLIGSWMKYFSEEQKLYFSQHQVLQALLGSLHYKFYNLSVPLSNIFLWEYQLDGVSNIELCRYNKMLWN